MLERVQKMVRGELPPPGVATLLGFQLVAAGPGTAEVVLQTGPRHANPMGTLHGGILCDIADAAMGMAYGTTLQEGESFTTLELKINFLRPVWESQLRAVGRVVRGGKMVGLLECDITDHDGQLVARASSTCLTLRGDQARGR
jgi:uncharacterized protein (TIGR00369 family)